MSQYYMLMTETGLAKASNAQVTGDKIDITDIAVGDGGGSPITPAADMTALVNEVYRMPVSDYATDDSIPSQIIVAGYIPTDQGGWTIREVGVFDADGDLIAIGNLPDTPKPVLSDGVAKDLLIRATLEVANAADAINVVIDPTVVIASRQYVDESIGAHNSDPDAHPELINAEDVSQMIYDHNSDEDAHPDKAEANLANVDASDVLEKVKEVDGSGSGLDTDLVRGKNIDVYNDGGVLRDFSGSAIANQVTAWVVFDGADGTILDAHNISSVTRNDKGNYTVLFDAVMANANYGITGAADGYGTYSAYPSYDSNIKAMDVDGFGVRVTGYDGSWRDPGYVSLIVVGGK